MTDGALPRSTPEAQGVSSEALGLLLSELDVHLDSVHGVVVVRHGHVVAEASWSPYAVDAPHSMYSVSKSFTATAVGFAVAEGLLTADDRLIDLFPESAPVDPDARVRELRVRHLLTMNTGHADDTMEAIFENETGDGVAAFLATPLAADPGTLFVYNTGASYVLSALVQKLTGVRLLDYLTPRLFEPLGIRGARWEQDARGIDMGGFGLTITTRDLAAFGQLFLQRGVFGGERMLSEEWVAAATAPLVPSAGGTPDWQQGYGYQMWTSVHGYRGDGAFGQFCLVLPDDDAVIAITGSLPDMQKPLDALWRHREAVLGEGPLDENPDAAVTLAAIVAGLEVSAPASAAAFPAGLEGARYLLDGGPNDAVAVSPDAQGTALVFTVGGVDHRIVVGADRWAAGLTDLAPEPGTPIFARGGWADSSTFRARVVGGDDPHGFDHELRFDAESGERVDWTSRELVSFDPIVTQTGAGRRES
jgi:CubicO group peptidase (beta-lactamase class C family)